jgi:hypothetical protein
MPALRQLTCLLAGSASLLSLMPGLVAPATAADFREQYGRYSPAPAPQPDLNVTEEVQIEHRLSGPPVAAVSEPQCRAFTKRRFNEFGELVIRRVRICEEVVRGPASRSPGEPPRREVYGRPIPPTNIPFLPHGADPEELEEGEPG